MTRVIIRGWFGKMGQMLAECAAGFPNIQIAAGVDIVAPSAPPPVPYFTSLDDCDVPADVILDFTRADSLPELLRFAKRSGVRPIVATTGHTQEDIKAIEETSRHVAIFRAANMSIGINALAEAAAGVANALPNFDVEIIESHHNTKVDAPSGTAYLLANIINEQKHNQMEYVYDRHCRRQARAANEIGMHAIRGGTIAGEHEALFAGPDEIVTLTHKAYSRKVFALGALRAAEYLSDKPAGLYTMRDLLLEKSGVTHMTVDRNQAMLTLSQLQSGASSVARVLRALAEIGVNIDMISQTAPIGGALDLSFTLPRSDVACATQTLQALKMSAHLEVATDIVKLTVAGPGMATQSGVAARVFDLLGKRDVQVRLITTAETQISMCIDGREEETAARELRAAFNI